MGQYSFSSLCICCVTDEFFSKNAPGIYKHRSCEKAVSKSDPRTGKTGSLVEKVQTTPLVGAVAFE